MYALYVGGNESVLVVAGVVMNFTNILPQRFNNKRFEDYDYHDNRMESDTFSVLYMQTHYSMWVGSNDLIYTNYHVHTRIPKCMCVLTCKLASEPAFGGLTCYGESCASSCWCQQRLVAITMISLNLIVGPIESPYNWKSLGR